MIIEDIDRSDYVPALRIILSRNECQELYTELCRLNDKDSSITRKLYLALANKGYRIKP